MLTRTWILAAALLLPAVAGAQGAPRAWAMAGAGAAAARGLDAVELNPANLAFSGGVTVGLLAAAVDLHNNAFSLARYNEITGATLDESDKRRLLADIPSDGFDLDVDARASCLGIQAGRFAVSTQILAAGRGNLDRDFFDLVLFGNPPGETVTFDSTEGEGQAVGALSLSYGQPVATLGIGRLAAGATVRYLRGLYEVHVEEARGSVTTSFTSIDGAAYAAAVTSDGGSGYAMDLGLALQATHGWTLALAVDNFASHLSWTGTPERHVLTVTADDLSITRDDLDNAVADTDTTYAISAYSTTLPGRLRAGASRDTGRWLVAADVVQGLRDRAGASTTPQLNAGAEWRLLSWFTPRAGLSLGGTVGHAMAGGLGLRLGALHLDLAVLNRGGFVPANTRGIGFAVGSHLEF